MKIKHWQGYGTVDAKNVSKKNNPDGSISVHIKVTGNHEYGIEANYSWVVAEWLLSRFDKNVTNDRCLLNWRTELDATANPEVCDYYITYKL